MQVISVINYKGGVGKTTLTAKFVNSHINLQFVTSILRDKLLTSLNDEKYFVLKLKPEDKLFRF